MSTPTLENAPDPATRLRWEYLKALGYDDPRDYYCRPLTRKQKLRVHWQRFKWWINTQITLWHLRREAQKDDPKGGAEEVARLRKILVIAPLPDEDRIGTP